MADTLLTLSNDLEGRDKLTKLTQYSTRAIAYYILAADPKSVLGQQLTALFKATQSARKAFRVGKSFNYGSKISATLNNKAVAPYQRNLQLVQDVGMCTFFLFDNAAFFGANKVLNIDTAEAMKRGGYFWFCANVAGFVLAYEALKQETDKETDLHNTLAAKKADNSLTPDDAQALLAEIDAVQSARWKKTLTLLKSTCDLIVSSNTAGVRLPERILGKKLHDGIIGAVGCVSASVVLYNIVHKKK
ncbi:hypothetical protein SDRG_03169 [Saprolegnia diclina VS20]|uniref:Peroxisomal biogenesis factor 11 n=1 Tax=Saprolegnia diclina (strain VS20) TaxID=1156394 RepID=T0S3U7_SAPDV|nr:hypothetical protein SDRG_03169 [Saprolegnia diclina VS20]EQC39743.1 hypothetical protein SDRG_03169 [Saprolegnia diclina VS20]|eukprot:XP_008607015.1 hypothetical protein SDRG_03169 [Saprolegnia diclina VS20]